LASKQGERIIAGAFFADDQIIWDVVSCGEDTLPGFTQKTTAKILKLNGHSDIGTTTLTFEQCLAATMTEIAAVIPEGASVDAFCVAMPGPMVGSGVRLTKDRPVNEALTSAWHRMGWSREEIDKTLASTISELKDRRNAFSPDMPFIVHTDAAAYCVGDYQLEVAKNPERERPQVFAHIVVDEGVGGALVVRNRLLDTGHHSEIGHLPIRQHESDLKLEPECAAHNFRGCAESYISLPALRRRWGSDAHLALRKWTDKDEQAHLIAYYLAQMCVSLILTVNADAIRFSGRVSRNAYIVGLAAEYTKVLLQVPNLEYEAFHPGYKFNDNFIGRRNEVHAGIYGCIVLAFEQMQAEG
jgi:predicted NBD/HSP70 family sugar kinase